jgi:hypothetical protein
MGTVILSYTRCGTAYRGHVDGFRSVLKGQKITWLYMIMYCSCICSLTG